jgi:protein TonB
MRDRISKAKAHIAVRNYNAAIYELEQIRRETSDSSVHAVTNILLMNSYLEQGNYKKAQDLLNESFKNFKANNAHASMFYSAVAGQAVKGARNQIERYRLLGLSVSDRNLPLEAVNDIEKMRETLELVITQTREAGADKVKASVAMPLLEEATAARSSLGRDDYDAKRWRDEGVDIREQIASSRSVVINATDGTPVPQSTPVVIPSATQTQTQTNGGTNSGTTTATPPPVVPPNNLQSSNTGTNVPANLTKPIDEPQKPPTIETNNKPSETQLASNTKPIVDPPKQADNTPQEERRPRINPESKKEQVKKSDDAFSDLRPNVAQDTAKETVKTPDQLEEKQATPSGLLVEVGSLLEYATAKATPSYPSAARTMRASGVVKVEVVIDENGDIAEIKKANGHALLQGAAKDAIRRWKFRPVMQNGQPVRASGFVNFNFTL